MDFDSWRKKGTTSMGFLNFIGTTIMYFNRINFQWKDSTQKDYYSNYINNIFPNVDVEIAVKDYNEEKLNELILRIVNNNGLDFTTIETKINHLLVDPINCFYDDHREFDNPFWGNASDLEKLPTDEVNERMMKLKKSFTSEEENQIEKILLSRPDEMEGEKVGLAIIFSTGVRNNEACGLNFGDIREFDEHNNCYFLQVYKTTKINRNELKASGKTYNSPRRIPITGKFYEFLERRKSFLENMVEFPVFDKEGNIIAENVMELPIACRGSRYWTRCSSGDLSIAGKELLSKEIRISEEEIAAIDYSIKHSGQTIYDDGLDEKDPTTYLMRRNIATKIGHCGFDINQAEYYMGHVIKNPAIKRNDFCDEDMLYELWKKINCHKTILTKKST